jgi:hypothetical protein
LISQNSYDFEECTSRLKKELSSMKGNNIEEKQNKKNDDSIQYPSNNPNEINDPESINNKKMIIKMK